MNVQKSFIHQSYYLYLQALELVYLLDVDAKPHIDDVQEVNLALRRLLTINKVNAYYQSPVRIIIPMVTLEGNC